MLKRFATAAVFILAVCVLGAKPTPAAQYKLKMQTYYSPTTAMGAKYFAEQVNKLTGGRVEIQVFTGGELVGSANILKAVRNGMIDIGHGMGHHFGLLESGLPMSWMSAVEADVLYERRGLKKLFGDDYAKLGVVYLGPTWAAPYHTLSKQPIRSLDEMRKMKIRAVGATAKMLSAVGVNVVNLPPEDIYMALTTGQIDGVVYGSAAEYKETKFYETLKQYLLVGNNVSMAAKKMFIHRNTMIYRLSKINEILGVDINEPGIAHKILISILLQEQEKEEK